MQIIDSTGIKMRFTWNDGGRAAAGYEGEARDCVCRSIAIATGKPYQEVHDALNALAKRERTGTRKRGKSNAHTGVYRATTRRYMQSIGWRWVPTMQIGQGCKVHLSDDELPSGRLVVSVSRHMTAVINAVIHDTHDPSRGETRCVYGYFIKEKGKSRDRRADTHRTGSATAQRKRGGAAGRAGRTGEGLYGRGIVREDAGGLFALVARVRRLVRTAWAAGFARLA
jgi:hypothetical protein